MLPTSFHGPAGVEDDALSSEGGAWAESRDQRVAVWLGVVAALAGGVILFGWIADMPALRGLFPRQVEAKANTAVCFILLGTALALKAGCRLRAAPGGIRMAVAAGAAGLATLVGLLTLFQYLSGRNLGLDELLFREPAGAIDTVHPGRMALPTALTFVLLGSALLGLDRLRGRAVLPALLLPPAAIAGLAFVGHLYNLPFLASLGPFTPIAAPTGLVSLLLCLGLLHAGGGGWLARLRRSASIIGFVVAVLVLALMGGAVVSNTRALVDSNHRVNHTQEVLGKLAAVLSAMQDLETGTRGYLLTRDRTFLAPAEPAPAHAHRLLDDLRDLLADNPGQQAGLQRLARSIEDKVTLSRRQIAGLEQGDQAGPQDPAATRLGKELMDAIRAEVAALEAEEERLLLGRLRRVETSTQKTMLTLGLGLVFSVGLLFGVYRLLRGEIRQRTRTAAALRRSEESLAVTLHSIGDAVLATDTAGRVTRLNPVAEKLCGWTLTEARGRPVAEVFRIIHEETRRPAPVPVDAVLATGEIKGLANHTVLIARDGTERAIADSAAPIRDAAGRLLGVVLVFRDVTQEQAARKALRESEERYRTLFESIDQGFCLIEMLFDDRGKATDYRFLETNPAFEHQSGLRGAVGRRVREFAPHLEAHWFETLGAVAVTGAPVRFQNRAEALGRAYDIYAFRFGDPGKKQVAVLFSDITERQRAQEELDRFFTLSLDFLCIASADGTFKRASPGITEILGWSVEEFLAQPYLDQVHPDDRAATQREVEHQMATGEKVLRFENRYRHKDGSWRVLSWRSSPHGGLMYATARDVTELKNTEARIRRLNDDLARRAVQMEAANQELESFSYSVSHDLRAPLRHVQGYVEMLTREAGTGLSEKARRYLTVIASAAREMGELIDDLLAFSRMGRSEMQMATLDLDPLVAEVRTGLEFALNGRAINWTVAPLPRVRGDAAMLRQVFVNLLGNAVKYTRARNPARIEVGTAGAEDGRIVVFVRDNGAGFDMKYADKLFGVFQRLHRADEFEGTGIGLASVRRIVNRHGGRIWAEARVNEGATFYFTLAPAAPGPSAPPTPT